MTVTWFLALMTMMAGAALSIARTSSSLASSRYATVDAEVVADSAMRRAILALMAADPRERWPVNGEPTIFSFYGESVTVRVTDDSGRIDLNGADAALLSAVLASNDVGAAEALAMAARVIDWRDADDTPSQSGAERLEYRARGLSYGPRNAPFESVDELALVLGMPRELWLTLAPLFTVYTGQSAVNQAVAAPEVLAVLKWADLRQWDGRRWLTETAARSRDEERSTAGRVFRLTADVPRGGGNASVRRGAVVRMTGNIREPVLVYSWSTIFDAIGSLELTATP